MSKQNTRFLSDLAQGTILAAKSTQQTDEVIRDLLLLKKILEENPEIVSLLSNPSLSLEDRQKSLKNAFKDDWHDISYRAACALMEQDLLRVFGDYCDLLIKNARELANHHICTVSSAIPIDDTYREQIKMALTKKFNGTVHVEYTVDPSVIGGLAISSGDWRYLGTVQAKLKQLSRHLITT
ncbi:MAG TPA: ATP synthase F1 subunit delta [bacterium]|nr:MAG: ATP synthase subunit delta [Parcubacteria group bacterium ADurb.Bin192]HPN14880.1 ATP synthase F1 subunit delta [bacterium]